MAGGNFTPEQLQALQPMLYQQAQGLTPAQLPGLLGAYAGANTSSQGGTPQLYRNWTDSLLQPYMKQFGMAQQPNPALQLQKQIAMLQRFMPDPNITPSGGGH